MSHRDRACRNEFETSTQDLLRVIDWLVPKSCFRELTPPKDGRWSFRGLVVAALLWVWSDDTTLTGRFAVVRGVVCGLWPAECPVAISFQAFQKRLVHWTETLSGRLKQVLRERMQGSLRSRCRMAGRLVFGVDGSKLELPRTVSNEGRFAPAAARVAAVSPGDVGRPAVRRRPRVARRPTAPSCGSPRSGMPPRDCRGSGGWDRPTAANGATCWR